jgi:hypothetical protein
VCLAVCWLAPAAGACDVQQGMDALPSLRARHERFVNNTLSPSRRPSLPTFAAGCSPIRSRSGERGASGLPLSWRSDRPVGSLNRESERPLVKADRKVGRLRRGGCAQYSTGAHIRSTRSSWPHSAGCSYLASNHLVAGVAAEQPPRAGASTFGRQRRCGRVGL